MADPIPIPEPLATDLQTYLVDVEKLRADGVTAAAKADAARQAQADSDGAAAVVATDRQAVAASLAKVQADLAAMSGGSPAAAAARRG